LKKLLAEVPVAFYNKRMKNEIRAFITAEANDVVRKELARVQAQLKKTLSGDITWVNPDNIHLTLRFLGHITDKDIENIKTILRAAVKKSNVFNMDLGVLSAFPNLNNPRVLWIGVNSGFDRLNELNAFIAESLEHINFPTGEKFFHPHFTLARIKSLNIKENFSDVLSKASPSHISGQIQKIALYKSNLTPGGAVYTCIQEEPLS